MQKVKIITTSGCDLTYEEAAANNILMIPDWVIFGEEELRNNIDIVPETFYTRIASEEALPTSAHPSPAQLMEAFAAASEAEEIICIVASGKMAGTFNTASFTAEQMMEEGCKSKIYIFDSQQISFGMGILALDAARMAAAGDDAKTILDYLNKRVSKIGLFFVMNTLDYARRGGRIGAIPAVAAETLGVKPLLTFGDGIVNAQSFHRTFKSALKAICKKYVTLSDDHTEVFIFHANNERGAQQLKALIQQECPQIDPRIEWVGPVVGLYSGPGCVGIAFREKDLS